MCQDPNRGTQIHHLDEDPSHHSLDNLAVLCLHHHDEASKRGGNTRSLNAALIRRYRDAWLSEVEGRRGIAAKGKPRRHSQGNRSHQIDTHIAALVVHDIRNLHREIEATFRDDWSECVPMLYKIGSYIAGDREERDDRVKLEVAQTLERLASFTRFSMPNVMGNAIKNIAMNLIPWPLRPLPYRRRFSATELSLLRAVINIAQALGYDSTVHMRNIGLVDDAGYMLSQVLRVGLLNKHKALVDEAKKCFAGLEGDSARAKFSLAERWLRYLRSDAEENPTRPMTKEAPEGLIDQVFNRSAGTTQ